MPDLASSVAAVSVVPGDQFDISQQLARDLLEGCYKDYLFFCLSPSVQVNVTTYYSRYILLVGTVETSASGFDCSDCVVYDIRVQSERSVYFEEFDFTGSDSAGSITGNLKSNPLFSFDLSESYYSYEKPFVSVSVPSGCVLYGSGNNLPHLVEGGEMYAFSGLVFASVAAIVLAFCCIWRKVS